MRQPKDYFLWKMLISEINTLIWFCCLKKKHSLMEGESRLADSLKAYHTSEFILAS